MRVAKMTDSLRKLRELGVPATTILDVGVQHKTLPLMSIYPDLPHLLFEPITDYFPHIHQNYKGMNYEIVNAAVSDKNADIFLHSEKKYGGNEISHSWIVEKETETSRKLKSITLDSFLGERGGNGPYLLKIDVEGADVPQKILKGAVATLAKTSAVIIEMTVDTFVQRSIILHENGFDLWDLVDSCYYGDCLWQVDAVFISRKLKSASPELSPMHIKPFQPKLWQQL